VIKTQYDKKNPYLKKDKKKFHCMWVQGTRNTQSNKLEINLGNHKDLWILPAQPLLQTLDQVLSTNLIMLCTHLQGQKA